MVDWQAVADRVWYGHGAGPAAARAALGPLELLFRAGVAARAALYDRAIVRARPLPAPAISVGNLSVGGTGKTPVAAWVAARLAARGARPAILLRGYGDDEPLVHAILNPGMIVAVSPDRSAAAADAVARGADALVLDDAFQHRRAARDVDLVLVSAERWAAAPRMLPAGPLREAPGALRRASAAVVTRRVAPRVEAERVAAALASAAPDVPSAVVALALDVLRPWAGAGGGGSETPEPLASLAGERVLAVAAVGDPASFFAQLAAAGATVDGAQFRDHHRFTAADVAHLAGRAERAERVVCTLKDAVKLGPLWPRLGAAIWYVSQRLEVERGAELLDALVDRILAARRRRP